MNIIAKFYLERELLPGSKLCGVDRVYFNRYVFDNIFEPRMKKCQMILLNNDDKKLVTDFAEKKAKAKWTEWKGFDDRQRAKRELTGASIEYALLKYFGKQEYFDNSIVANSRDKAYPDLKPLGLLCDIKGSTIGNVPLILKDNKSYVCDYGKSKGKRYKCPNLICVTDKDKVWFLGIASPQVLSQYSDDNLIKNAENTNKTGFYGADKLIDLPNDWEEFKKLTWKLSVAL